MGGADDSKPTRLTEGTDMTIQAIETAYAGCRFRSRLEARWAVFFNALDFKWEYEPQGFQVSWRLRLDDEKFNYLPDFWLPEFNLWAEVKGHLGFPETDKLLNAAASLSSNDGGGCHDSGGSDLLVLGPIPQYDRLRKWAPTRLHMHKGDLVASNFFSGKVDGSSACSGISISRDVGLAFPSSSKEVDLAPWEITSILLDGFLSERNRLGGRSRIDDALDSARQARFEHGERG